MRRLAWLLVVCAACSGGAHGRTVAGGGTGAKAAKADPIKPAAMREFEAAMRAIRLGGPDADDTAKARLKHALEIDSQIWEAWTDLGVIAWNDGEDDGAVDDFTKALAIHKDHVPTLLARAEANRRGGHKKEARADYEAAIKVAEEDDPNRANAATRLASLLRDTGDYDDAVEVIRDTVRQSGANAKIYTELGMIYIAQKQLDLAQLVLQKALELDAKDPSVLNALAILAMRQGKAQEAFERFDAAVSLDATFADARFNKASVLLDAGDYARAKVELAAIIEKKPDDYAAHVALGVAQRGLKDFPSAKTEWERVIKEAPKKSGVRGDALFDLALLQIDFMNDPASGKATLEQYLQEAPSGHAKRQAAEDKRKELGK
jgi:Tfp pilus assembly protein PilF